MVTRGERWSAGEAIFEFELPHQWDWVLGRIPLQATRTKLVAKDHIRLWTGKKNVAWTA